MKLNQPNWETLVFISFDNWLISVFQGFVTAMELNTPITRQRALKYLLVTEVLGTALFSFVTVRIATKVLFTSILSDFPLPLRIVLVIVLVSNLAVYCLGTFVMYIGNKEKPSSHALPRAIEMRRGYRFLWLSLLPGYLTILMWWIGTVTNPELDVPFIVTTLITFCLLPPLLFPLHEYTLCTKVLPPGEKERKKCEREMGNRTPAG